MHLTAYWIFSICAAAIAWVYVLYPMLLLTIGLLRRHSKPPPMTDEQLPSVTMLIPAFNEAAVIASKIENALDLDYPPNKLRIVVVSDCSTDGTDAIVQRFQDRGVQYLRNERQKGKIATLSDLGAKEKSDVILITDANAIFERSALRRLVSYFDDPSVGMVTGNKTLRRTATLVGEGEGTYQNYETVLRRAEANTISVTFVTGAMTAIRRELFKPLPEYLEFDHVLPQYVVNQGYRVAFAEDATFSEETAPHTKAEYRVRVRNATRGFSMVLNIGRYLDVWRHPVYAFHLFSRKILRWLIAIPAAGLLVSSLVLVEQPWFRLLFVLQLLFYLVAAAGYFFDRRGYSGGLVALPFYFCLVNFASLVGLIRAVRGEQIAVWSTER